MSRISSKNITIHFATLKKKVQVGKDREKAQSEKDPHWEKTKLTIRYFIP